MMEEKQRRKENQFGSKMGREGKKEKRKKKERRYRVVE
jgi:hypothetical protein